MIGWCAFHTTPVDTPQLVHKRVTHTLPVGPFNRGNLLCLLSCIKEHHDATLSLQYKAFLSLDAKEHPDRYTDETSGRVLVPVDVEILNLGEKGEEHYGRFWPSSFGFLSPSLDDHGAVSDMEGINLDLQYRMMQDLTQRYEGLLEEYQYHVVNVRKGLKEIRRRKAILEELKKRCNQ